MNRLNPVIPENVKKSIARANRECIVAIIDMAQTRHPLASELVGVDEATLSKLKNREFAHFERNCNLGVMLFRPRVNLVSLDNEDTSRADQLFAALLRDVQSLKG